MENDPAECRGKGRVSTGRFWPWLEAWSVHSIIEGRENTRSTDTGRSGRSFADIFLMVSVFSTK